MRVEPGQELLHYKVLAKLGEGGMGVVWKALDTRLGREVALKTLSAPAASDTRRLALFEGEARAVAAINHPNIVTIHAVEQIGEDRLLVMELVRGTTLDRRLAGRAARARAVPRAGAADRGGAGRRTRAGRDPPRRQAVERHGRGRRRGESARLRAGQAAGAERAVAGRDDHRHEDTGKPVRGDAGLHVARAAPGSRCRSALRRVLAGGRPVRDGHGAPAVPRRVGCGTDLLDPDPGP